MSRHIVGLTFLFLFFFGVIFLLLNTPFIFLAAAPRLLATLSPATQIDSLKVGRQSAQFPENIVLYDVDLRVITNDVPAKILISQLTLNNVLTFWRSKDQLKLEVEGLSAEREDLRLNNVKAKAYLTFSGMNILPRIEGVYLGQECLFRNYRLENFSGRLKGQREGYQLYDLTAQGYGGQVSGQITLEYLPAFNFTIWLEYTRVNPKLLAGVFDDLFLQLDGEVNGSLRLFGNDERFDLVDLNMQAAKGQLGSPLAQNIYSKISGQRKEQLAKILIPGSPLAVKDATARFQSTNDYRVNVAYNFKAGLEEEAFSGKFEVYVPSGTRAIILK